MQNWTKKSVIILGLAIASLTACSTLSIGDFGKKHFLTKSEKPAWVNHPQRWASAHKGEVWFIGTSTGDDDETIARIDAKAQAMAQIADRIRDTVHHFFNSARTLDQSNESDYSIETERAIEDGVLSVSRAVITGASVNRYFARQYWVRTYPGAPRAYYRDEYCLLSMSIGDYQKTVFDTLNGVKQEVKDERAQHVLDFMKKHYLRDLNSEKGGK